MSPKQLANLKPARKGEPSRNPEGGRLHDPVKKALKRMTEEQIAEVGTLLLESKVSELTRMAKDPNTTVLKAMLAAVAAKAITTGDQSKLGMILDRIAGPVTQRFDHTSKGGRLPAPMSGPIVKLTLPANGRTAEENTLVLGQAKAPIEPAPIGDDEDEDCFGCMQTVSTCQCPGGQGR